MNRFIDDLKNRANRLKIELCALYLAYRDPRVPWYARAFAVCVIGYAVSPIDLIPDPIPVLGYLDDLILIPLGIYLALKMIPPEILDEHRACVQDKPMKDLPGGRVAACIIAVIWILTAALVIVYWTASG